MRTYAAADEERIRVQADVRDWTRAGLLDDAQGAALGAELRTDLRRTNALVRAALALFSALMLAASVALVLVILKLHEQQATVIFALAALGSFVLAEYLAGAFRFYRHGVEETAAVLAVVFLCASAMLAMPNGILSKTSTMTGLVVGAAGGFVLYLRFGYIYAAIGAMACAAMIPFETTAAEPVQRLLAAGVLAALFVIVRARHLRQGDDFPGDEYASLEAAAWLGVYLLLNLRIFDVVSRWSAVPRVDAWFYWGTYVVIWLMPVLGLFLAIREKNRMLLSANLVIALGTLVTNKPYLQKPSQTWDPMVLGLLLMVGAVVVRRWLANAPGGQRNGYTAARILASDRDVIALVGTASAAWQQRREEPPAAPPPSEFGGGRSGGAGGGAGW
jgi:hypothetical protein